MPEREGYPVSDWMNDWLREFRARVKERRGKSLSEEELEQSELQKEFRRLHDNLLTNKEIAEEMGITYAKAKSLCYSCKLKDNGPIYRNCVRCGEELPGPYRYTINGWVGVQKWGKICRSCWDKGAEQTKVRKESALEQIAKNPNGEEQWIIAARFLLKKNRRLLKQLTNPTASQSQRRGSGQVPTSPE